MILAILEIVFLPIYKLCFNSLAHSIIWFMVYRGISSLEMLFEIYDARHSQSCNCYIFLFQPSHLTPEKASTT